MWTRCAGRSGPGRFERALTVSELLVLVAVIALLVWVLGPKAFEPVRTRIRTENCARQLRSIGVAFRLYAGDYGNLFPTALMHDDLWLTNCEDALVSAWRRLSNELATPRLLVCPGDTRFAAVSFESMTRSNLSYFMSIDASPAAPQMLLAGDRNISSNGVQIGPGFFDPGTNCILTTTKELHRGVACLLFVDSSVTRYRPSNQPERGPFLTIATNRLAIP